jgi:hypothetical protein
MGSMIIAINHANAKSNNGPASSSVMTANRSTKKKDNPMMASQSTAFDKRGLGIGYSIVATLAKYC